MIKYVDTRFIILLFSIIILYPYSVTATIFAMDTIEQLELLLTQADKDSLVIFDVDEVLVYPENVIQLQIASPFWDGRMLDLERRLGSKTRDLLHSIMLKQSYWKITDQRLPHIIANLQFNHIKTIALTAFRSGEMGELSSIEDWRSGELRKRHIDFNINSSWTNQHFNIHSLSEIAGKKMPVYKDGIIYTNHHPKGKVLFAFLAQVDFKPKKIFFVDDRMKNIIDLKNACLEKNISFLGVHDTRIINQHNSFDPQLGAYQFEQLESSHIWLSDQVAKQAMEEKSSLISK